MSSSWSIKDEAYIKRTWGKRSTDEIASFLGRNAKAVASKAKRMGLGWHNPANSVKQQATKDPEPKPSLAKAGEALAKQKSLSAKETDAILHQATASRPPTWEEAEQELREAIEMCCHAGANHPLTKQRCQMLLMAWNVLDIMEKI